MTIKAFLSQGILLVGLVLMAARRARRRPTTSTDESQSAYDPEIPRRNREPGSDTLAGVPRDLLMSERSGPGALLRDTLMIRPSANDQ